MKIQCLLIATLIAAISAHHLAFSQQKANIPVKMWYKLKDVNNTKDFIKKFLRPSGPSRGPSGVLNGRFIFESSGKVINSNLDFAVSVIATPGGCTPRFQNVGLDNHEDPSLVMWPQCTKIEQCGGCCGHEKLECAPVAHETVQIQCMKAKYPYVGAEHFTFMGAVPVTVQRHLACECRCKVQPQDCSAQQEYVEEECRCKCPNEDSASQCGNVKIWDERKCSCECRNTERCDEGFFFNQEVCRCQLQQSRGGGGFDASARNPNLPIRTPCSYLRCRPGFIAMSDGPSCSCRLDPCALIRCRAGFRKVQSGSRCTCQVGSSYSRYDNYRLPGQ